MDRASHISSSELDISIIICTYHRPEILRKCLEQFFGLRIPTNLTWEILVINNSQDSETNQIVQLYENRLPVRLEHDPITGLSRARNTAVKHAKGALLLWIDDDSLISKNWLSAYFEASKKWPDAAFYGGPVERIFDSSRTPRWVVQHQEAFLLRVDFGNNPILLKGTKFPIGANMGIWKKYFSSVQFDPTLGMSGENYGYGEETEFFHQLEKRGHFGMWTPDAKVFHLDLGRSVPEKLLKWHFEKGKLNEAIQPLGQSKSIPHFPKALYWRVKFILLYSLAYFEYAVGIDKWIMNKCSAYYLLGRLAASKSKRSK